MASLIRWASDRAKNVAHLAQGAEHAVLGGGQVAVPLIGNHSPAQQAPVPQATQQQIQHPQYGPLVNNPQAQQRLIHPAPTSFNLSQAAHQSFGTALHQTAQSALRTAPEIAATIAHPGDFTYHPNSRLEQWAFGKTPVQNIQKIVHDTQKTKGNAAAIGLGLLHIASDIPGVGAGAKGVRAAEHAIPKVKPVYADHLTPAESSFRKNAKEAYKAVSGQKPSAPIKPAGGHPPVQYTQETHNYLLSKKNAKDVASRQYIDNLGHIKTLSHPDAIIPHSARDIRYLEQGVQQGALGKVSLKPKPGEGQSYINTAYVLKNPRKITREMSAHGVPAPGSQATAIENIRSTASRSADGSTIVPPTGVKVNGVVPKQGKQGLNLVTPQPQTVPRLSSASNLRAVSSDSASTLAGRPSTKSGAGQLKSSTSKGQTRLVPPTAQQAPITTPRISAKLQASPTSSELPIVGDASRPVIPNQTPGIGRPQLPQLRRSAQVDSYNNNTPIVKQRGVVTSVKGSDQVSPNVKSGVSGSYEVRNTAHLAATAEKRAGNLSRATKDVNASLDAKAGTITDQNIADAIAVAKAHDAKGNFDQAQHIYDKLAEHGTKGGQQIQAFSLLSSRTPQGMKFQALRSLKKAGIELDGKGQADLQAHVENVKNTTAGTPERDMALHKLVQFVNDRIPSTVGDKLVNFWRAGLLTSPVTTGGNILGNTSEAAARNLWVNPVAATADKAMSLVTGKRTKTLTGGQLKGAQQGLGQAKTYLKTGFDPRNPSAKFDAKQINYNNKAINTYVNGVYRWMGGQDQPFYYAAQRQAARDLATADAKNLKLAGKAKSDYIAQAEANPNWKPQTFKSKSNAETSGKYAVYQNDTLMGHIAAGAKNYASQHSGVGGAIANFLLPFTQVPASVAMRIIDRTPLGIAKEVATQAAHKSFDQRALAEAIGNGTFAPGVIYAGAKLAQSGHITGAYPTDPKEQEIWKSQGKQPFSVRVGNRWYSLNYMQPFGTLLSIGGQVHTDMKNGNSAQEAWGAAGATAAKSIESQSFLQGLNGVLSAVNDPQRSASKYITSTASSVVPNFIRATARATDPLQRDVKGVINGVKGAIPGIRETLPAKQDMFGKNLPANDNTANQLFNPFRPSIAKNDPVVNELARLQDAGQGIIPTQFNKSSITGQKLNDSQVRQLQTTVGGPTYNAYKQIMNDPRYAALSDEQKKAALAKAGANQSDAQKRTFSVNNQIPLTKPATKAAASILTGQPQNYFATTKKGSGSATTVNPSIDPHSQKVLNQYNALDAATRNSKIHNENDYEYKVIYAKYQNDKANGTINDIKDLNRKAEVAKAQVGSSYPKDVRDLYTLAKDKTYQYITTTPGGQQLGDQLKAYDQALYDAGLTKFLKYKNGLAPAAKRVASGRTRSSGSSRVKTASTRATKGYKTAKPSGTKFATASYKLPRLSSPRYKTPHLKTSASKVAFKAPKIKGYKLSKIAVKTKTPSLNKLLNIG